MALIETILDPAGLLYCSDDKEKDSAIQAFTKRLTGIYHVEPTQEDVKKMMLFKSNEKQTVVSKGRRRGVCLRKA